MKLIRKDFNKVLLYLIIVPLILLSLATIYYQTELRRISAENQKNKEKLEGLTGELILERQNRTITTELKSEKDREILERLYDELKTENEELKKQNEALKSQLYPAKAAASDENGSINKFYRQFNQIQNSLIDISQQVSRLSVMAKEACEKLKSSGIKDEKC